MKKQTPTRLICITDKLYAYDTEQTVFHSVDRRRSTTFCVLRLSGVSTRNKAGRRNANQTPNENVACAFSFFRHIEAWHEIAHHKLCNFSKWLCAFWLFYRGFHISFVISLLPIIISNFDFVSFLLFRLTCASTETCYCTCWITINNKWINVRRWIFDAVVLAFCKSSLNHLQLPYIRATHKLDFFILFLTIWMDILTLICACGALTRTLSVCFDHMTGGMARIYILGRNAPENEPWPDVIGFSIIFIVSVMFMLGLEVITTFSIASTFHCFSFVLRFYPFCNLIGIFILFVRTTFFFAARSKNSKVFSYILVASLCGIVGILIAITSIRGNLTAWQSKQWLPKGVPGVSQCSFCRRLYPINVRFLFDFLLSHTHVSQKQQKRW